MGDTLNSCLGQDLRSKKGDISLPKKVYSELGARFSSSHCAILLMWLQLTVSLMRILISNLHDTGGCISEVTLLICTAYKHKGGEGQFPQSCTLHLWVCGWQAESTPRGSWLPFLNSFSPSPLNQTAGEEVILFPWLSLVQQDILFSRTVLNEELGKASIKAWQSTTTPLAAPSGMPCLWLTT